MTSDDPAARERECLEATRRYLDAAGAWEREIAGLIIDGIRLEGEYPDTKIVVRHHVRHHEEERTEVELWGEDDIPGSPPDEVAMFVYLQVIGG